MELSIERKIEIESKLIDLLNSGKTRADAVIILMKGTTLEETLYILSAYMMPYDEIKDELYSYDESYRYKSKLSRLKFIDYLCKKYNHDKAIVQERIEDVRKITQYKEENQYVAKVKKRSFKGWK